MLPSKLHPVPTLRSRLVPHTVALSLVARRRSQLMTMSIVPTGSELARRYDQTAWRICTTPPTVFLFHRRFPSATRPDAGEHAANPSAAAWVTRSPTHWA
jgi:hypothetical protein